MGSEFAPQSWQWFYYDDSGYYPYVLLNVSDVECAKVQKTLTENGLVVLLSGKSCRPAGDGAQYQWYVRLDDDAGKHPARDKVERILVSCGPPRRGPTILRLLHRVLPSNRARQEIRMLKTALADQAALFRTMQIEYESYVDAFVKTFEPEIKQKDMLLQKKDAELREQREHIDYLISQVGKLYREEGQPPARFEDREETLSVYRSKNSQKDLFRETLRVLLPDTQLLLGTIDTLWQEMHDPIAIDALKKLRCVEGLKGEHVEATEGWKEQHVGDFRLYFKNCGQGQYQALISHKKNQTRDIKRLGRH